MSTFIPVFVIAFLVVAGFCARPIIDQKEFKKKQKEEDFKKEYKDILDCVKIAEDQKEKFNRFLDELNDRVIVLYKSHKRLPYIKKSCGELSVAIESKRLYISLKKDRLKNVS